MTNPRHNIRTVTAPRGATLNAKSWLTEAPLRMLMNNLDAEVAEKPHELVVYGAKFPTLTYDPATLTLTLDGLDPATARTRIAYLAISGGTTGVDVPGSLLSGAGGYGHFVGLTPDPFYFGLWVDIFPWLRVPNAQGIATWNGVPPLSALIGQPVYVVAGTLDASVFPPRFESYTDPISL